MADTTQNKLNDQSMSQKNEQLIKKSASTIDTKKNSGRKNLIETDPSDFIMIVKCILIHTKKKIASSKIKTGSYLIPAPTLSAKQTH